MANQDTIVALFGGTARGQVSSLTLASTTETAFSVVTDSGTAVAVLTLPVATTGLVGSSRPIEFNKSGAISSQSYGRKVAVGSAPPYFNASTFDGGRPFRIVVAGTATSATGTGNTILVNLYSGTSATLGSDTKLGGLTAGGASATTVSFYLTATLQWNSTTQALTGQIGGLVGNALTAQAALTNSPTITTAGGLSFVVSAQFGNAVGGSVTISEISCEQI